jgi:uncharacterized protein (DUF427 family)
MDTEAIRTLPRASAEQAKGERVRAVWNGTVLAESDRTVVMEGDHYFPPEDVEWRHLEPTSRRSTFPWKGAASYFTVVVDGDTHDPAAWCYPDPPAGAEQVRGRVAFRRGVQVVTVDGGDHAA